MGPCQLSRPPSFSSTSTFLHARSEPIPSLTRSWVDRQERYDLTRTRIHALQRRTRTALAFPQFIPSNPTLTSFSRYLSKISIPANSLYFISTPPRVLPFRSYSHTPPTTYRCLALLLSLHLFRRVVVPPPPSLFPSFPWPYMSRWDPGFCSLESCKKYTQELKSKQI